MQQQVSIKELQLGKRILTTDANGLYLDGTNVAVSAFSNLFYDNSLYLSIDANNRILTSAAGLEVLKWNDNGVSLRNATTAFRTILSGLSGTSQNRTIYLPNKDGVLAIVVSPQSKGLTKEIYIAFRTDGVPGVGSKDDPYDGSTTLKFDTIMVAAIALGSIHVHLGPGVFTTKGSTAWLLPASSIIEGAGIGLTTLKFDNSAADGITYNINVIAQAYNVDGNGSIVRDLFVDCNSQNLTITQDGSEGIIAVNGVLLYGSNCRIERVRGSNAYGSRDNNVESFCLMIQGASGAGTMTNSWIIDCITDEFKGTYGNGQTVTGFQGAATIGGGIINPRVKNYWPIDGVLPYSNCTGAGTSSGILSGGIFEHCLIGVYVEQGNNITIRDNTFLNTGLWGVYINPAATISGITIENNEIELRDDVSLAHYGVAIAQTGNLAKDIAINDNTIRLKTTGTPATEDFFVGINVPPTTGMGVKITGNRLGGHLSTSGRNYVPADVILRDNRSTAGLSISELPDTHPTMSSSGRGMAKEIYISIRTDGRAGTGTPEDPFDAGGTTPTIQATKFDAIMASLTSDTYIHLSKGTFYTIGRNVLGPSDMPDNCHLEGAGKSLTTLKLVANSLTQHNLSWIVLGGNSSLTNIEVSNLTIDTNRTNQSAYTNSTTRPRTIICNTTSGSTTITKTAGIAFTSADIGFKITGTGLNPDPNFPTFISSITDATHAVVSLAAVSSQTGTSLAITSYSSLGAFYASSRNARIIDVKVMGCWADPGEGFPFHVNHLGGLQPNDRIDFICCENLDSEGYSGGLGAFDQSGTGRFTGIIEGCTVANNVTGVGIGASGTLNYQIKNNIIRNVYAPIIFDTWANDGMEISGNQITGAGAGGGINCYTGYDNTNLHIHDNYISNANTGGTCIYLASSATMSVRIHDNTLISNNPASPAISLGETITGSVGPNKITETTKSLQAFISDGNERIFGPAVVSVPSSAQAFASRKTVLRFARADLTNAFNSITTSMSGNGNDVTMNLELGYGANSYPILRLNLDGSNGATGGAGFFGATPVGRRTGDVGAGLTALGLFNSSPNYAAASITGDTISLGGATFQSDGGLPHFFGVGFDYGVTFTFETLDADKTVAWPNKSGIVALTDDITTPIGKMLFVDAGRGDNGTALPYRSDKPYLTCTAAKAVAVSGDTIVVRAGTYTNDYNLLKNGVNWHFMAGAIIAPTASASGAIFDDHTGGANEVVNCVISGAGTFNAGTLTRGVLYLKYGSIGGVGVGSNITMTAAKMTSTYTTVRSRASTLYLRCPLIESTAMASNSALWWDSGPMFVEAMEIRGSGPATIYSTCANDDGFTLGYLWVKAQLIKNTSTTISSGYKAVWFQDDVTTVRGWIDAMQIQGPIAIQTTHVGSVSYVKAEKIFGQINIATTGGGKLYLDAQKVSDDGLVDSLIKNTADSTSISWLNIGQLDDAGLGGITTITNSAATMHLKAQSLTRSTAGTGVSVSGGVVNLSSTFVSTQGGSTDLAQTGGTLNITGGRGSNANGSYTTTGTVTYLNANNATTVGRNIFTLTNPSAITFLQINADNTVTARTGAQLRGDIGADNASNLTSGTVGTARLGSGTANNATFLRGDQVWAGITVPNVPATSNLLQGDGAGNSMSSGIAAENVALLNAVNTFTANQFATTATAGTNSTRIATTAYADNAVAVGVTGLLKFQGATDCSTNPNYPSAVKGDGYIVSVAGKIGGASGTSSDVGDWYIATANNAGGTEAADGTSWAHLEHNLVGALLASNNLSDLSSSATARANLSVPGLTTANTFTASQIVSGASFSLSGNISAPAWTTGGIRYANAGGTLTDTTSTGTVTAAYTNVFGGNFIAASNAVTFTDYYGSYFAAPIPSTNVTFSNRWALGADSLKVGNTNTITISTAGVLTAPNWNVASSGNITANAVLSSTFQNTGGTIFQLGVGGMRLDSTHGVTFSSGSNPQTSIDTGIFRNAAGVVEINNGTAGTLAGLTVATITGGPGLILSHGTGNFDLTNSLGRTIRFSSGNITPLTTNVMDIGGSSNVLSNVYTNAVRAGTSLSLVTGGADQNITLTTTGTGKTRIVGTFNALTLQITDSNLGDLNGFGPFGSNAIQVFGNGTATAIIGYGGGYTGIRIPSDGYYAFSNTTSVSSGRDTALMRNAAGVVEINNGTAISGTSNTGKLKAGGATFLDSGTASTSALTLSGVPFTGTGTTSFPLLYVNDAAATASTTLKTAGTYLGVNGQGTADLMNLMVNGVSQFKVSSAGLMYAAYGLDTPIGGFSFYRNGATAFYIQNGPSVAFRYIIVNAAGSADAPAYGFEGNTNVGMYSSATNVLDFSTSSTNRLSISSTGTATFANAVVTTPQSLSGAGAVNLTTSATAFTSTGAAQALTLADGVAGQIKTIAHVVKGASGTGVLTPTTKTGYTTITFTNAGDSVMLQFFTTAGWCIIGSYGVTIA